MFGLMAPNPAQLEPEQRQRYMEAYCGLCKTLGKRHGQLARAGLAYDLAFLVMLLDSLEEPEQVKGRNRCIRHPLKVHAWRHSCWTDYAADMNVALMYHKCLDDWRDEGNRGAKGYADLLEPRCREVQQRWPEQCALTETCLRELAALEAQNSGDVDGACDSFGRLMAGLFAAPGGFFEPELRSFGMGLGRFIYLMDAVLDEEQDTKKKRWNPVARFREQRGGFDERAALELCIGEAAAAFERLPLEEDLDLLRNILYSGVWTQYTAKQSKLVERAQKQKNGQEKR